MESNVRLAPPWAVFANRVRALFEMDSDVAFEFEGREVKLRVKGDAKAEAIERLLPQEVEFGNVTLAVTVVPANCDEDEAALMRAAFAGNPVLACVAEGFGPAGDVSYALFEPEVVQLREDDISKYDGLTTLTYEELARSVLAVSDVRICSAPKA